MHPCMCMRLACEACQLGAHGTGVVARGFWPDLWENGTNDLYDVEQQISLH